MSDQNWKPPKPVIFDKAKGVEHFAAYTVGQLHEAYAAGRRESQSARTALADLLKRYTELVNCGDCGNWNPEDEEVVKAARSALESLDHPVAEIVDPIGKGTAKQIVLLAKVGLLEFPVGTKFYASAPAKERSPT